MKNGIYKVSIEVEITDCQDVNEATSEVWGMLTKIVEDEESIEVNFELTEESHTDYTTEEDELEELNFEEAV